MRVRKKVIKLVRLLDCIMQQLEQLIYLSDAKINVACYYDVHCLETQRVNMSYGKLYSAKRYVSSANESIGCYSKINTSYPFPEILIKKWRG